VAQIEVTEDSVREQVDSEVFARAERLAGGVSGLTVTGTLIAAVVDGVTVAARVGPAGLDGTCACPDPVPCAHAVSAVLAWVRSSAGEASLLAEVEDALADGELDVDFLDELVDDIEDLLDEDPAAVRDLADRVMNLLEARDEAGLTDLLERVEELWLEARQVAGPAGPKVVLPGKPSYAETRARRLSLSEPMVASTALGSYPQCAMQLAQRGSLPRPNASQSVVSSSSAYVFA
jgi:uncharacterized Zn finger protein